MKRSNSNRMNGRMDESDDRPRLQRVDKMSLHFVLPLVLFYLIVGLLLIFLNDLVSNVAAWALAAGLVVVGAWLIVRYFRSDLDTRLNGIDLSVGLILLLAGILLMCSPSDMKEVFPKIWGLSLIFGGFLKIQYAFDEKSVKIGKWWIMLIFAVISLAIGVMALLNKSVFGENQHLIIGIFMICEAVLDLTTYFIITRGLKKKDTAPETPAVPAEAAVPSDPAAAPVPQAAPAPQAVPVPQTIPVPQVEENLGK